MQEDPPTPRLAQPKLREDAGTLARRLVERGIGETDAGYKKIAEILPIATAQMDTAERKLLAFTPRGALQPEQRALQQLQRAEAVFKEIQVRQGQQGGGGGGGGGRGRRGAVG